MNHGQLRVLTSDREYTFPHTNPQRPNDDHENLRAELRVIHPSFWIRLALMSDLGFAEVCRRVSLFWLLHHVKMTQPISGFHPFGNHPIQAFMYGEVECFDLVSVFQIFIKNRKAMADMSSTLTYLATFPQRALTSYRFLNTVSNS